MTAPLKVLFVTPEAHPYYNTGGLADVARSLPDALRLRGIDVRLMVPLYAGRRPDVGVSEPEPDLPVRWPNATLTARCSLHHPGPDRAPAVLLEQRAFFNTRQPYGHTGEEPVTLARRFAFLARAAVAYAARWGADVIHINDWQTGLVPVYALIDDCDVATVMTVHNLPYQGNFPAAVLSSIDIPPDLFRTENGLEFHGRASFMKAGLALSDRIVAVSPTYAREVQTPQFGAGLEGLLRFRRRSLHGILNGITPELWNPATDAALPAAYSADDPSGKDVCRGALLQELGLEDGGPLFVMVTRLAHQKGIDLQLGAMQRLLDRGGRFALLGDGTDYAASFETWAARAPGRVALRFEYDDALARRLYAGGDFFLMPSLYEPCGLGQMIAQRYGTVPVVRRTGGLADTVEDGKTGFSFDDPLPESLADAIERAAAAWRARGWLPLRRKCMKLDRSWSRSARDYEQVYHHASGRLSA